MIPFEDALRIARAIPTSAQAALAVEALPDRIKVLESENVILRAALALLRGRRQGEETTATRQGRIRPQETGAVIS
jgi:hypothetical protein